MAGKNKVFSGVLSVAFASCIIFVVLYFFYPTWSLKYFGTTFDKSKALTSTLNVYLEDVDFLNAEQKKSVSEYLTTEEGQKLVDSFVSAAKKGGNAIEDVVNSDEAKRMAEEMKGSFTQENLEDLLNNLSSVSSSVLSGLAK